MNTYPCRPQVKRGPLGGLDASWFFGGVVRQVPAARTRAVQCSGTGVPVIGAGHVAPMPFGPAVWPAPLGSVGAASVPTGGSVARIAPVALEPPNKRMKLAGPSFKGSLPFVYT